MRIFQEGEQLVNSGFWITWYNQPEKGRDDDLSWVHGAYIPKVLARPGVLSAAHRIWPSLN